LAPQNPNQKAVATIPEPVAVSSLDKALQLAQAKLQNAKTGRTTSDADVPAYAPGQYISCVASLPVPAYHAEGWLEPEAEYTWIDGTEALIKLLVRRPRRVYVLTLDIIPNAAGAAPQVLEVFFNYFRLAAFEVPAPMKASLEIPAELFTIRVARLSLYCPRACPSPDHSSGQRRLGIAVKGWSLR
jgi:hypothetical protein